MSSHWRCVGWASAAHTEFVMRPHSLTPISLHSALLFCWAPPTASPIWPLLSYHLYLIRRPPLWLITRHCFFMTVSWLLPVLYRSVILRAMLSALFSSMDGGMTFTLFFTLLMWTYVLSWWSLFSLLILMIDAHTMSRLYLPRAYHCYLFILHFCYCIWEGCTCISSLL